jgi:hypothetical protein
MYYYWSRAEYSSFIEIDKEGNSPVTMGNLLFLDHHIRIFNGGVFQNTCFIKIHSENTCFSSPDGIALYYDNNNVKYLKHHIRKGNYPSEFEIPDTVICIDDYAFSNCENLNKIKIPNSVESIGKYAFSNCSNLTEIVIPNSVESIGEGAFEKCISLEKIELSKSLLEIEQKTFLGCKKLNNILVPASVIAIGEFAFGICENLHEVILPISLRVIQQQRAFEGCKNVKFKIKGNPFFSSEGSMLFNTNKTSLIAYPSASGEVTVPEYVTRVEEYAFSGCDELQKIIILNSIEACDTAFSNCAKLSYENIIFPKEDIQIDNISSSSLKEAFEFNLVDNKFVEIKTGCVYDDENKTDIVLYLFNFENKFFLDDGFGTFRYLDKMFELSQNDVRKNIRAITEYFGITIRPGEKPYTWALSLQVEPSENLEEQFLKMFYCIGFLNNMKIFYT